MLRKLGFTAEEIRAMPESEAKAWLLANHELHNPPKKKTFKVLKKYPKGKGKSNG